MTVLDHPYFAVSAADGTFTIKDVPPGKYKVVAMHRKGAPAGVEKEIEVKSRRRGGGLRDRTQVTHFSGSRCGRMATAVLFYAWQLPIWSVAASLRRLYGGGDAKGW